MWQPESSSRWDNHSGAPPPSASKPSSACIRLRDMHAQLIITNTKWFDFKTNIEVWSHTKRQPVQHYMAQCRPRWLGHHILRIIILPAPSTHSTRRHRDGQFPRGAMRQRPRQRRQRAGINVPIDLSAGGQPLLFASFLRPRGKILSPWVSDIVSEISAANKTVGNSISIFA